MKALLFFSLFFGSFSLFGQVKISGNLTDNKGNPLRGASITIKDSYDGATTDSLGNFSFLTTEKGPKVIEATISGYSSYSKNVSIDKDPINLTISIKELVTELKAVVLTAGSFEASDAKKTTVLSSIDIVTTASANGDITSALKTLPGTQQVGEVEGLFVRGGTATETKTFIDGTLVNNFYFSSQPGVAQRGRFNPFLFKGTVFSAGGYSALYGQALSSALILETIDLPERSSADLAVSYLGIGGGTQQLARNKKSSWGISYNYVDLRLAFALIKQKQDYFKVPFLHELDGNFRIKTKNGMIKYYGTFGTTNTGFRYADIDSLGMKNAFNLKNLNTYHNLSWKEKLGSGYKIATGFSYSINRDDITGEYENALDQKVSITDPNSVFAYKNFALLSHGNYANAKIVVEKKLKGLSAARVGVEDNYSREQSDFTLYNGNKSSQEVKENLFSAFGEADVYITNDIAAKLGTRAEYSKLLGRWNIAPRVSLAYKLADKSQASFAYGIFYQDPERKYLPGTALLNYAKSTQYILQYQKLSNARTFRTELFYKKYDDLFKTAAYNGRESAVNNNGYGDAKGIEFFWRDKKSIKNVDYWISYSYLDTKRDFLNYPKAIVPSFAARNTLSVVVKKFVTKIKTGFNASYTYSTGRPYYDIRYDNNAGTYKIYDEGNAKDYNSMSFSLNYLPNLGKAKSKTFMVFVFSVNNVLGANNIYSYNYSYDGKYKQPVLPTAKRFFYLGCFLSFGIDRTQDAINNNL